MKPGVRLHPFREHLAREIDVPVEELDGRVARCLEALFVRDPTGQGGRPPLRGEPSYRSIR